VGRVARMGAKRGVYRILVGKPAGKRTHGWPRCRWEDNTKISFQEVSWHGLGNVVEDRDRWRALVNAAMNLRIP